MFGIWSTNKYRHNNLSYPIIMLSHIAQTIQDSPTMAIGAKARMLSQQGEKIIDLGVGYLDHEPPIALTQGLIKALDKKNTGKYIATA